MADYRYRSSLSVADLANAIRTKSMAESQLATEAQNRAQSFADGIIKAAKAGMDLAAQATRESAQAQISERFKAEAAAKQARTVSTIASPIEGKPVTYADTLAGKQDMDRANLASETIKANPEVSTALIAKGLFGEEAGVTGRPPNVFRAQGADGTQYMATMVPDPNSPMGYRVEPLTDAEGNTVGVPYAPAMYDDPSTGAKMAYDRTRGMSKVVSGVGGGGTEKGTTDPGRLADAQRKEYLAQVEAFQSSPTVKASKAVADSVTRINDQLDQNVPGVSGIVATNIARAIAGDMGALAEGDIMRASGNQSAIARMKRLATKLATGKMTQQDVTEIKALTAIARQAAEKNARREQAAARKRLISQFRQFNLSPTAVDNSLYIDLGGTSDGNPQNNLGDGFTYTVK